MLEMLYQYCRNVMRKSQPFLGRLYRKRLRYIYSNNPKICRELKENGYSIIYDYYSAEQCRKIVDQINSGIIKNSQFVKISDDKRIFGFEKLSLEGAKVNSDINLSQFGDVVNGEPSYCAFTLAGYLEAGALGSSGDGWHRDAYFSQFKAMIYLSDVDVDNGPFEIIPTSHKLLFVLKTAFLSSLKKWKTRFTDEEVMRIKESTSAKSIKILGKLGTLVLFNSATIHRGSPIKKGFRYSLTNYYYPFSVNYDEIKKVFNPIA